MKSSGSNSLMGLRLWNLLLPCLMVEEMSSRCGCLDALEFLLDQLGLLRPFEPELLLDRLGLLWVFEPFERLFCVRLFLFVLEDVHLLLLVEMLPHLVGMLLLLDGMLLLLDGKLLLDEKLLLLEEKLLLLGGSESWILVLGRFSQLKGFSSSSFTLLVSQFQLLETLEMSSLISFLILFLFLVSFLMFLISFLILFLDEFLSPPEL